MGYQGKEAYPVRQKLRIGIGSAFTLSQSSDVQCWCNSCSHAFSPVYKHLSFKVSSAYCTLILHCIVWR